VRLVYDPKELTGVTIVRAGVAGCYTCLIAICKIHLRDKGVRHILRCIVVSLILLWTGKNNSSKFTNEVRILCIHLKAYQHAPKLLYYCIHLKAYPPKLTQAFDQTPTVHTN
jgi:hypothetical protein